MTNEAQYTRANTKRTKLGTFTMGGVCRVTDPCYGREVWCTGTLFCKPGTYTAFLRSGLVPGWGKRVTELEIVHESLDLEADRDLADLHLTEIDAGVDSGQCGFFDDARYVGRDNEAIDDEAGGFYDRCGNLTLGESAGGVVEEGAVSLSGYGDGGYSVYTDVNPDNEPIAFARLVFIAEGEDEAGLEDEGELEATG